MRTSLTIPEKLYEKIKQRVEDEGFMSVNDFLLSLVREEVNQPKEAKVSMATGYFDDGWYGKEKPTPVGTSSQAAIVDWKNIKPPDPADVDALSSWLASLPPVVPVTQPRIQIDLSLAPQSQPVQNSQIPDKQDNYLIYGGKCQYRNVSPDGIICLANASRKLNVALNQTGDVPADSEFQEVYLCPDHIAEVSHRSGFFVK